MDDFPIPRSVSAVPPFFGASPARASAVPPGSCRPDLDPVPPRRSGQCPAPGEGRDNRVNASRELLVTGAFVSIADSLIPGYDAAELYVGLTAHCVRVLDIASAGLLTSDSEGVLHVSAATAPTAEHVEVYQVRAAEGPCLDCYRTGAPVLVPDLTLEQARFPRFAPVALAAGIASVHALPMRVGDTVLGSLDLFGTQPGALSAADLAVGRALAYGASIALLARRAATDRAVLADQLQHALDARIVLEQAKGIFAQFANVTMDEAFAILRRYARDHNRDLPDIARAIVARRLPVADVITHARSIGLSVTPTPRPVPRPGAGVVGPRAHGTGR